jgi:apolipoprotein N-acyltransferase
MAAGTAEVGVLICYESIFAELSRDDRRAGADLLVNITNDAWYGRDTPLGRTTALWQHPAHLVLRAIETRTGIARAANTGVSLFIDPLGRRHGETRLFHATTSVATVLTTDATTLFVRWGDWVGGGASALAFLTIVLALLGPARPIAPGGPPGG